MVTLKTLPQATEQEVADHIITHLLTQGVQCNGAGGTCLYRNTADLKCAAGCCVSDEEYREEFEGRTWPILAAKGLVPKEHAELIRKFQYIHDRYSPENWERELRKLVSNHGLKFPEGAIK